MQQLQQTYMEQILFFNSKIPKASGMPVYENDKNLKKIQCNWNGWDNVACNELMTTWILHTCTGTLIIYYHIIKCNVIDDLVYIFEKKLIKYVDVVYIYLLIIKKKE